MKIRTVVVIIIVILIGYNYRSDISNHIQLAKAKVYSVFADIQNPVFAASNKDKNGLYPGDYDKNGWAKLPNGKWVSNPREGALVPV